MSRLVPSKVQWQLRDDFEQKLTTPLHLSQTTTIAMNVSRLRVAAQALPRHISKRTFTATARQLVESGSGAPTTSTAQVPTSGTEAPSTTAALQAPNRADVWSRSQQPRNVAMTGPRFEQTDLDLQVGQHQKSMTLRN